MKRDLAGEIRRLNDEIRSLKQQVRFLKKLDRHQVDSLLALLRHRGMTVFRMNPVDDLFLPTAAPLWIQEAFYERLHRYSFRLLLRDFIGHREDASLADLTRYCSEAVAAADLDFLVESGAAEEWAPRRFRLRRAVRSFGQTLEWYVYRLFREVYAVPALYGVRFKGSGTSGDYDVLSELEGMLIYLEVKSSPPRGIEAHQVAAFLDRVDALIPHAAVFLNDTELRMKDKLVPFFEDELKKRSPAPGIPPLQAARLVDEIFAFGDRLFVMNSRKSIAANLGIVIRRLLAGAADR